jgi:hypothetical protein
MSRVDTNHAWWLASSSALQNKQVRPAGQGQAGSSAPGIVLWELHFDGFGARP